MAAASIELQKAFFAILTADSAVVAALPKILVNGENVVPVFDKVPAAVMDLYASGKMPTYVTLGEGVETYEDGGETEDANGYVELTSLAATVHVWSQQIGMLEAKALALLIRTAILASYRAALTDPASPMALPTNTIKAFSTMRIEYARLEDGITSHAAVTFRVLTQPDD